MVVIPEIISPSLKYPVISQANNKVSILPKILHEMDFKICLFDIFKQYF
jgi:hypothetical protein